MIVAMERTSGCSNDRHVIIATVDGFRLMDIHTKKILVQSRHHLGVLRHKGFHFASGRFFDLKRRKKRMFQKIDAAALVYTNNIH